jgi:hypothetical protein
MIISNAFDWLFVWSSANYTTFGIGKSLENKKEIVFVTQDVFGITPSIDSHNKYTCHLVCDKETVIDWAWTRDLYD